jgi:hypothetical protein
MPVDSYKFLPRSFRDGYEKTPMQANEAVWTPLTTPVKEATIALLTSAGFFLTASQEPFDVEREKREPNWGDPTYRVIPRATQQSEVDATHLHLNTDDHREDFNIALPLRAFASLEGEGAIGALADDNYAFMGFQGGDTSPWQETYGPEVVDRLKQANVDAVVLAPA